jgi:hypothetical protein
LAAIQHKPSKNQLLGFTPASHRNQDCIEAEDPRLPEDANMGRPLSNCLWAFGVIAVAACGGSEGEGMAGAGGTGSGAGGNSVSGGSSGSGGSGGTSAGDGGALDDCVTACSKANALQCPNDMIYDCAQECQRQLAILPVCQLEWAALMACDANATYVCGSDGRAAAVQGCRTEVVAFSGCLARVALDGGQHD